ncbi:MAG TPA: alpha-galactosidase, partial [Anaerolineae bacterium]
QMRYDKINGYRPIALIDTPTGREWIGSSNALTDDLRLILDGVLYTGTDRTFTPQGFRTRTHPDGTLELQISLVRGPLTAHMHYLLFPWTGAFEQWVAVENTGTTVLRNLTALDSISLSLSPSPEALMLYWVQGLSPKADDRESAQALPVLRLRSLELVEGVSQDLGSSARSSEDSMGWFVLAAPGLGEGLVGGIEWSGAWRLSAGRSGGQTILRAGMQEIRRDLAPGDVFESPRRFLGFYQGDLDAAANVSHTFARTFLLRPAPADFPWTQYNTWYAFGIGLDEDTLKQQVDAAAALGLEVFTVDAGWYEGSPREGDFGWGLGTWRVNQEKFPNGLESFSEYVHNRGLRFGLWVEPERVDLRYAGPDQEIPWAWLAPEAGTGMEFVEGQAPTAQVCLGNPGAREWMKEWLARLIRDDHVDWLKWDNNLWMSCDPPGVVGDANHAHIQGLYEVLDYLRAEFPNLIIENCASGGNRMDYALMRRTDIAWLSDETDPSYRVRYHMAGASYPFPPEYLNTWLIDSASEPLADTTDPATLRAWLRSRMMGAFGISADLVAWSPELRAVAAIEIEQYKTTRQMIANSRLYRLLPQTELKLPDTSAGESLEPPASPDAAEFINPMGDTGAVFLFRGAVPWSQRRVTLKGLDPDMLYLVTSADRTMSLRRTGLELMTQGIRFRYNSAYPSTLLFFQPGATDAPLDEETGN